MDHHEPQRVRPVGRIVDTGVPAPAFLQDATAAVFGFVAAVRSGRALHTRGVARTGTAELTTAGVALGASATNDVVVRFSRGGGLPSWLPDINGVAIRFLDVPEPGEHMDLLLASAGPGPLRRILMPSRDFGTDRFSTLVRYRLNGRPVVLTAAIHGDGLTLARLGEPRPLNIDLTAVYSHGEDEHLGSIRVTRRIDDTGLRFDPAAVGPNLVPMGLLNALRPDSYAASQRQDPQRP